MYKISVYVKKGVTNVSFINLVYSMVSSLYNLKSKIEVVNILILNIKNNKGPINNSPTNT
jgi:hypothetical protein